MNTLKVTVKDKIALVALDRGKSNAINAEMVAELNQTIRTIENDTTIGGMILTGKEGFFSAGLDLIELYDYDDHHIKEFWNSFLNLTASMTAFKKPLIAAISGHSPAGGCVLALCADYRIMTEGHHIIGLNEVQVGLIAPETIFHLYAFWLGQGPAYQLLLEGKLMQAEEALQVGLVNELVQPDALLATAEHKMRKYIQLNWTVWQQSKLNLRRVLLKQLSTNQTEILDAILKQWWSPSTRSILNTVIQNLKAPKLV
ncbi:MAG: enoyl-CoA hydratase/isomerase family protein [Pedobacter sp.]|jgi:enoyl-CoA hydratase/carnithine racemase|nr:MAG: enoyl-CoA hydratase/isomerase family protein [Pedobacter sp.]